MNYKVLYLIVMQCIILIGVLVYAVVRIWKKLYPKVTIDGVTYPLPRGWQPLSTMPVGRTVNLLRRDYRYLNGAITHESQIKVLERDNFIAWYPYKNLRRGK